MSRFAAAVCVGIGLGLCALALRPALAQDAGTDDRCFPWQEYRNGICAPKPGPPAAPTEPGGGAKPPACPASSHLDLASGGCVANAPAPPATARIPAIITCNGGTASAGQCACPTGFRLMPASSDPGGTCVRTDAENCLGGAMTVTGQCLCIGQVTMSGQVYDLEFAGGKCIPKRCPREGPCVAAAAKPGSFVSPRTSPRLSSDEAERHRSCGRGEVATRHGCVPARHHPQTIDPGVFFRIAPN
jgi:hypothetical protein